MGKTNKNLSATQKSRTRLFLYMIVVFSSLTYGSLTFAVDVLTDDRKKKIVYEMYHDYKQSFPEVKEISVEDAMALAKTSRVVFVDIRKSKEQKVSMLPGAITEKAFLENLERYKDATIIGYCTISYRSGKLAERLAAKGIEMLNLRGGLLAWVHEGGKVYDRNGETKRVHVYTKKWNYLPEGHEAIWSFFNF